MLKQVEVCDVCEIVGRPVKHYDISQDARAGTIALCSEDAAPLERVLKSRAPSTPRKAAAGRPRTTATTVEEIERRKAARNAESAPA